MCVVERELRVANLVEHQEASVIGEDHGTTWKSVNPPYRPYTQ